MATADGEPTGPRKFGRGVHGQYVYWICMVQPTPDSIEKLSLKVPSDFTREEFRRSRGPLVAEKPYSKSEICCSPLFYKFGLTC